MKLRFRNRQKKAELEQRSVRSTGSAKVFSYYASRSRTEMNTGRQDNAAVKKNKFRLAGRRARAVFVLCAVVMGAGLLLWVEDKPNIEVVSQTPNTPSLLQKPAVYQKAGQEMLNESPMNRLKLTVNTNALENKLKQRFPEINEVAITMPVTSRRLLFKIQPATPAFVIDSRGQESFIIDGRGVAVVKAANVPSLARLKLVIVNDESGLDINIGKPVLPGESVDFISGVIGQLKAQNLEPASLILPTVANELHIRLAGEGYLVKFNMAGDARLQSGAFVAVKKKLAAENKKPAEYIDVRVNDKVFYK